MNTNRLTKVSDYCEELRQLESWLEAQKSQAVSPLFKRNFSIWALNLRDTEKKPVSIREDEDEDTENGLNTWWQHRRQSCL